MRAGYLDSMQAGGVDAELAALHREALTRVAEAARLDELCHRMRTLVAKAGVEETVSDQVLAAYRRLGTKPRVAGRSSATGEDGRDASFAGMNKTITNVAGEDALIDVVQNCWASLFTPRVLTYRSSRGFAADPAMAVVVQRMIAPDQAGVAFTKDPSTGEVGHHFGVDEPGRRQGGTPHGSRCRAAPAAGVGTGTQRKSLVGTIAREEQLCYTLTPNRQSLNWTR